MDKYSDQGLLEGKFKKAILELYPKASFAFETDANLVENNLDKILKIINLDLGANYSRESFLAKSERSRKRVLESALGRIAARRTLSPFLLEEANSDLVILKSIEGFPIFPEKITGSIAHTNNCAVAISALKSDLYSIGIDIEDISRAASFQSIYDRIVTSEEDILLSSYSRLLGLLVFSAKESVYKAYFPKIRHFFGFKEACINFDNRFLVDIEDRLKNQSIVTDPLVVPFSGEVLFGSEKLVDHFGNGKVSNCFKGNVIIIGSYLVSITLISKVSTLT